MKLNKIIVLSLACFCLPALADSNTDAVILSTQTTVKPGTRINLDRTAATIENGDVWIWGYRNMGLQGNGQVHVDKASQPARVEKFVDLGLDIMQIATGRFHILALDENGDVWGWGRNKYREATGGVGATDKYVGTPVKVLQGKNVINIYCSDNASYALTANGEVWAWGRGNRGEMGNNSKHLKNDVEKIPSDFFDNRPVVTMGVGQRSAYAINDRGRVYAWGLTVSYKFCKQEKDRCTYNVKPEVINAALLDHTNSNGGPSATGINSGADIKQIIGGRNFMVYHTYNGEVYGMGQLRYLTDESFDEDDLEEDEDDLYIDIDDEQRIERDEEKDDEKFDDDLRDDRHNRADAPIQIIGKDPNEAKGVTATTYCRYKGCFAITKHRSLLTWGRRNSSRLSQILYGAKKTGAVVQRHPKGKLTKIDSGKKHLIYWNDKGEAYGVGSGNYRKFDLSNSHNRDWNTPKLDFLMNAMHRVYGEDYVLGQAK